MSETIQSTLINTIESYIYENNIIELKSRDFIGKQDSKLIEDLDNDIIKKLRESDYKFYILGYDETNKKYEPVQTTRYNDSRLDNITKKLLKKTKIKNINIFRIKYDEEQCIIGLIANNNS